MLSALIIGTLIPALWRSRGRDTLLIGLFMVQCALDRLLVNADPYMNYAIMLVNTIAFAYFVWCLRKNQYWHYLAIVTYIGTQLIATSLFLYIAMDFGMLSPVAFITSHLYLLVFTCAITCVQAYLIIQGTNGLTGIYRRCIDAVSRRPSSLRRLRGHKEVPCPQATLPTSR